MNAAELKPQPKQEEFLTCSADVCFFGGGAGSGKTFALLLENLYDIANPRFRSAIFRKTAPQIKQPGGLLDTSEGVYPLVGATLNSTALEWRFPSGATLKFGTVELPQDRFNWYGSQIDLLCFDEAQEFDEDTFWFLLSRNRSVSGAKCRVRCTCNPISDGWLRSLLDWWIGPDGFPMAERSGVIRWFIRDGDSLIWGDSKKELLDKFPGCLPKSLTFIPALVTDNKILLASDPNYVGNLRALPLVERERLLRGNWNVRATAGNYFRREWFSFVDAPPAEIVGRVRFWDRAASERRPGSDPDATVGLLLSKDMAGIYHVENVVKMFATPHAVEQAMVNCAKQDGPLTTIAYAQDPGSAGVAEAQATARALDGYNVRFDTATGSKEVRAKPVSAQAEAGNIKIVRAPWNDEFLRELENFPTGKHDDAVDALSGAHSALLAPTGGWNAATLAGTFIGGGTSLLVPRPVFTPRFSTNRFF
jgi:predicted phage terminase large subunit-like protein